MQDSNYNSFYAQAIDPVRQAGLVFALSIGSLIIAKFLQLAGLSEFQEHFPWTIATSFMLFFIVFNTVFSLSSPDMNKYWIRSVSCYAVLAIVSALTAYLTSSIPFGEAGTFKWLFIVFSFSYLVFLSMVRFMRNIVEFAEREDWQAPKKRRRNDDGNRKKRR